MRNVLAGRVNELCNESCVDEEEQIHDPQTMANHHQTLCSFPLLLAGLLNLSPSVAESIA